MQGSLNQYLIRISIFMVLILIVVVFLYPALQASFISNIYINTLIVAALIFGLIFNVYNLSKLNFDYNVLKKFNIHNSPQVFLSSSSSLKILCNKCMKKMVNFLLKVLSLKKF